MRRLVSARLIRTACGRGINAAVALAFVILVQPTYGMLRAAVMGAIAFVVLSAPRLRRFSFVR